MSTTTRAPISASTAEIGPQEFRRVLGHYPTGVCVVTALDPEHGPIGMTVGSFSSVSLAPALVSFMPTRDSITFDRMRRIGRFCVNVLAAHHLEECRRFAKRGDDRFGEVAWRPSPAGAPVIDGAIAWIDCVIDRVHQAGDHLIVVGAVTAMDTAEHAGPPMLFYQGGYGRFSTMTLTAVAEDDTAGALVLADAARPHIERLAAQFGVECHATGRVGGDLIQLAYSGPSAAESEGSKVGVRLPFVPPMGSLFVEPEPSSGFDAWLSRAGGALDEPTWRALGREVARARDRGWTAMPVSEGIIAVERLVSDLARFGASPNRQRELTNALQELPLGFDVEPLARPLHSLSAAVRDALGRTVLILTLNCLERAEPAAEAQLEALLSAANAVSFSLSGASPSKLSTADDGR